MKIQHTPNPTGTITLPKHIEQHKQAYHQYPQSLTAGAAYVSEQNYEYLESNHVEVNVKYSGFDKPQSEYHYKKIFLPQSHCTITNKKIVITVPCVNPWNVWEATKRKPAPALNKPLKNTRRKIAMAAR